MKFNIGDIVDYKGARYVINYICYNNNVYNVKCIGLLNIDNDTQQEVPIKDMELHASKQEN